MKKILVYFIGFSFLAMSLYNCEKDEDIYENYKYTNLVLSNLTTYPLNKGVEGVVEVSNKDLKTVSVYKGDKKLKDLSLSGGIGNYILSNSELELSKVGEQAEVTLIADLDGEVNSRSFTLTMDDPFVLDAPNFILPADTTFYIKYQLVDACADPETLDIQHTINSAPYNSLPDSYDLRNDSIRVVITSTMASDTLKYKFHFENENGQYDTEHQIVVIFETGWDFERFSSWTTDLAPWTLEDRDGLPVYDISTFDYPGELEEGSWRIFDYVDASENGASEAWAAHSGDKYVFCIAAEPDAAPNDHNDDWMISPNFDIETGYQLDLYAKSIIDTYGLERMVVKVVDNDTGDEEELTATPYEEVPIEWTNYNWSLDNWAGKNVHIEIGCVSSDAFALMIDDVQILSSSSDKPVYSNNFDSSVKNYKFLAKKNR